MTLRGSPCKATTLVHHKVASSRRLFGLTLVVRESRLTGEIRLFDVFAARAATSRLASGEPQRDPTSDVEVIAGQLRHKIHPDSSRRLRKRVRLEVRIPQVALPD